jgi:hypothetical protein
VRDVLRQARRSFPFIERIFADAGYQGPTATKAAAEAINGSSRSSSAQKPTALSSFPNAGSSKEPWPGSAAIDAWHATSSATPEPSPPSCASP